MVIELYRIVLPYACFSIDVKDGKIVFSAPIGHWAVGWELKRYKKWVEKKGGTVEKV